MQVNIKKVIGVHSPKRQKIQIETVTDIRRALAVDVGEDALLLNDAVNAEQVKKDDFVFVFRAGHTLNYRLARGYKLDRSLCVELKENPGTYVLLEDTFLPVKIVFPGGFKHPETKAHMRFDNADEEYDYAKMLGVGVFIDESASDYPIDDSDEFDLEKEAEAQVEEVQQFLEDNLSNVEQKPVKKKGKKKS